MFLTALDLLDDPHALYLRGNETVRAILNRAFFTRLYVDGGRVTDHELNEPFNMLSEAYTVYRRHQVERHSRQGGQPRTPILPARYRRGADGQSDGHYHAI